MLIMFLLLFLEFYQESRVKRACFFFGQFKLPLFWFFIYLFKTQNWEFESELNITEKKNRKQKHETGFSGNPAR